MNFSIIIPCFNEEESLLEVLKTMPKEAYEVIVVDNNSTDKTGDVARAHGAKVVVEKTQGYGAAIRKGLEVAKGDILVVLDGDGQYPAEKIVEVVLYLQKKKIDFISCARFPLANKKSLPFVRRIGNWLFTATTNILFGLGIKDSQSGMWVFKREVLKKMTLVSDGMPLSEEIKIKAACHPDIIFEEFHIPYYERIGESKLFPLKDGVINLFFLLRLRVMLWKTSWTKEKSIFFGGLLLALAVYVGLAYQHIHDPFIHVTADVNGQNGLAVLNFLKYGFFQLKFGIVDQIMLDPALAPKLVYTHHPALFVLPTAFFYAFFGVSELTTRLGPLSFMIISFILFGLSLRKIFSDNLVPLITLFIFAMLPGAVFYGKAFELAVFSLPAALTTFSFFVFFVTTKKTRYLTLFFLSLAVGGFMGWFYYFLPVSLWLLVLLSPQFKKETYRKKLLFGIPIILVLIFVANLFHFYLLNGQTPAGIVGAFEYRASRQPFKPWFGRIFMLLKLQSTGMFLTTALAGLLVVAVQYKKKWKTTSFFLPFIGMPIFVALVFSQWSTHPFGVIYWFPAVAVFSAIFLAWLIKKFHYIGVMCTVLIFIFAAYQSWNNLTYFYNEFRIIGEKDIQLLQEVKPFVADHQVCMGANEMGIGFRGIADWYIEKKVEQSPECLLDERTAVAIIFNPHMGQSYMQEAGRFDKAGFIFRGCADHWCLMDKGNILGIGKK